MNSEAQYPMLRGTIRDTPPGSAAPSSVSSPARKTSPINRPIRPFPIQSSPAKEPLLIVGAIAGG